MVADSGCTHKLERMMTPYGVAWHCSFCHGSMLNLASFKDHTAEEYTKDLWKLASESSVEEIKCPQCSLMLKKVAKNKDDSQIEMYICLNCQTIWFTQENLDKAQEVFPLLHEAEELPDGIRQKVAIEMIKAEKEDHPFEVGDGLGRRAFGILLGPVEVEDPYRRKPPYVTWSLIAITSIISLLVLFTGMTEEIFRQFGFLPSDGARYFGITMITSFFLHGSVLHLVSNMYFLWVFGDNVEYRLDWLLYVVIIFSSTILGNIIHSIFAPDSSVICIGASGGISGVLIFYCFMFPRKLLLMRIAHQTFPAPAAVYGLLWLGVQLFGAYGQIAGNGNVSYLGHLGGAAVGILMWAFLRNDKEYKYIRDL